MTRSSTLTQKTTLAAQFAEVLRLREESDHLRARLDEIAEGLAKAESLVLDGMAELGLTSFLDDAGNRATRGEFLWATPTDEAALFRWLRANRQGGLIKRAVNGHSLSALVRQLKSAGSELPDCVHVVTRPRLLVRRG